MKSFLLAAAAALSLAAPAQAAAPSPTYEFVNGRWWNGQAYETGTFYTVDGVLRRARPAKVDETIDLHQGYVIPPLAEAHNHWVEPAKVAQYNACYLADGVFYLRDRGNIPYLVDQFRDQVNLPDSVDFVSSMTPFTGPGAHPVEVFDQLASFGILPKDWKPDYDIKGEYVVRTAADIDERFELLLPQHPTVVKAFLSYSEAYEDRLKDPKTYGNGRGMDPKLLPHLVEVAHAAGLKVAVHVYTAPDFRVAVAAGVDQIAHTPGTGYRAGMPLSEFQITAEDARAAARAGVTVDTTVSWLGDLKGEDPAHYEEARDKVIIPNLKLLKAAGVPMLVGSDVFRQDDRAEIDLLKSLGVFSDREILRMATIDSVRAIFPDRKLGRLTDGYEADFLVLDRDPVADLGNLKSIVLRVKQGRRLTLPASAISRPGPNCVEGAP